MKTKAKTWTRNLAKNLQGSGRGRISLFVTISPSVGCLDAGRTAAAAAAASAAAGAALQRQAGARGGIDLHLSRYCRVEKTTQGCNGLSQKNKTIGKKAMSILSSTYPIILPPKSRVPKHRLRTRNRLAHVVAAGAGEATGATVGAFTETSIVSGV